MIEILHEPTNAKSNNIQKDTNDVYKTIVQSEKNKLIHEHDFITEGLEGTSVNPFSTYRITYKEYYCRSCGKLIIRGHL